MSAPNVVDVYPLSPMQEGLLYHAVAEPDSRAYVVQMRFAVEGEIDPALFRTAWGDLVARHDILRTSFRYAGLDRPLQVVLEQRDPEYAEYPSGASTPADVERYMLADRARGFDVARDVLVRIALFHTGSHRYELIWSYHHLLLDGWCLALLQREFSELYAARIAGREARLLAARPYREYIDWLAEQDEPAAQRYWSQLLSGYERMASVPGHAAGIGTTPGEFTLRLERELTTRLTTLAVQSRVTLSTLVNGLWGVLLARYNDCDDVVFGAVVSGRPPGLSGAEEIIGPFINAIPVRVRVDAATAFADVVRDLQGAALEGMAFHHSRLADIGAASSLGRVPFDHVLVFDNYPAETGAPARDALRFRALEAYDRTHFDFSLVVTSGEQLQLAFLYNEAVYDRADVERIARHFETAARCVAENAAMPASGVAIVPPAEAAALARWGEPAPQPRGHATIVELFEAQAAANPSATAVVFGDRRLSYAELNERANFAAARLRDEFGAGPDDRIGIMLDRSEHVVIAVLAVLKSGAAYVPVEPSYPAARVEYLLRDSACSVVICETSWFEGRRAENIGVSIDPSALAYLLYTSGTTGTPKGCQIEHRALAFYLEWANAFYFDSAAGGNFGLFSPLSFDLTVTSLFLPLLRGKTLTVFAQDAEPQAILEALFDGRHGIDTVKLTPSHVSALEFTALTATGVQRAIVGGEAFTPRQAQTLRRLNPAMRIYNEYGPTEATVGCIVHEVPREAAVMPIGRPIAGSTVAVLDRERRVQPVGVTGELYVGGPGLARGYRNRPDLDAERFLDDVVVAGRRMYRTGDFGYWLANGELAYSGRRDDQVKIRGFRVELGDVENALSSFADVTAAAAVARDGELHAYVEAPADIQLAVLRAHLADALPPFMIPSHLIRLDRMPLTPNGKIDKAGLPAPASDAGTAASAESADAAERAVIAIWSDVLGARAYRLDDNFFEVGGHSLKAMQILARLRKELGARVELRAFLARPTVAALAGLVRDAVPEAFSDIPRATERAYYDLSHAQQRLWLLHHLGGEIAYNMPQAFLHAGELDMDALRHALGAVLERHEALRTAFVMVNGEPKQAIRATVELPLRELDLAGEADPDAAARAIAERDATSAFALDHAPVLRLTVMHLAPDRHVLLFTIHHIIGDGWSMTVLHRDLLAFYESFRAQRAEPLPPLRIQYKDFSEWQNARDRAADEAYWLGELQGIPEALRLPYDREPSVEGRDFRGATARYRVESGAAAALRAAAAAANTTLSNVVLAAFGLTLRNLTGQDDFCVGMSVANRDDVDLEPLIGFFVNVLPIRFQLASATSAGVLAQTIATVYDAFEHQEYPFDLLVRRLDPARVANRQPLLNVVYGFQSFRDIRAGGGEMTESSLDGVVQFGVPFRTSKFDLCLFVSEVGDALAFELEYDTGLFEPATLDRMFRALENSLDLLVRESAAPVNAQEDALAALIAAANETGTPYPCDVTVHALFESAARRYPENVAVVHHHASLTYAELDRRSNDVANFLIAAGARPEEFVAVLLGRSTHLVVALLGILKAGCAYVPLSADVPYARLCSTTADTQARFLIFEASAIRTANKLQWDCTALETTLCIDSADVDAAREDGGIMDPAIWNYVAQEAYDDISGGGWTDSYTGEFLSREVMDGYGDNIRTKLAPLLTPRSRVLEIGCASGISMFRLAPLVETYVGTDLSPGIIEWSRAEAARRGIGNVRLAALPAHETEYVGERDFDLVILNSVIECFSGHNYLRSVLRQAVSLMKDDGYLFLGNIWDQERKAEFIQSLHDFKREFPERSTRMKLDRSDELSLSRNFIEDLRYDIPEIESIEYSNMLGQAESELSRFGFDAIVRIRKHTVHVPPRARSRKQFDRRALAAFGGAPVPERVGPRSLAYMMYTSGTSGVPKGVLIEHRSIVRLVCDTNYIDLGPRDAVLQTGALGFDASTFELWGPLLNGGRVVLPVGTSFLHASDLARIIREHGVTTLFLTTGLFNQIVDLNVDAFEGLRTLLTGGEKASAPHFDAVSARFPELALLHVYGPTENTTFSTFYCVRSTHARDVPIGRPIANTVAVVVDDAMRPVPFGTLGELCVGGDGLARGYWNDAALTAKKFVPHPLDPDSRVYRTGDFVRWQPGGEIEFVGRMDTQTKIRGFRIELEELEGVLLRHEAVTSAAVVASDLGRGETELTAFVSGRGVESESVLAHVRAEAPAYLVPSQVVVLPSLPLNANGKVDRRGLVVPDFRSSGASDDGPRSDIEELLLDIWRRLLQRPDIGVTQNFFRLGGHSLKVARMVSMIQVELGLNVALSVPFRAPTIRELAAHLAELSTIDARLIDDPLVALNAATEGLPIFAFPPGSGYCLSYLRLATLLPQPFYGLSFIEDATRLDDYVALLREKAGEPYVLFGYSAGGKLAFRVAQELERLGRSVAAVVIFDAARYLRRVHFSESDVAEIAADFLHEITSPVLREQATARMASYRAFIGESVEAGTIAADIHLVAAEESQRRYFDKDGLEIASLDGWRDLTTGRFREYQGSGTHQDMLKPGHLQRNVDILRAIIDASTVVGAIEAG